MSRAFQDKYPRFLPTFTQIILDVEILSYLILFRDIAFTTSFVIYYFEDSSVSRIDIVKILYSATNPTYNSKREVAS